MGRKLLLSAGFGIIVLAVLALVGDAPRVWSVLKTFPPAYLPAILLLTSWNYLLRFFKWHFYLKRLAIPATFRDSAGIFACGLAMAITPGKAGELLKSLLLRRQVGTPIATSAPIVLSERLTDGLAMVCLAATGLGLYHQALRPLLLLVIVSVTVVVLSQLPAVRHRLVPWLQSHPRFSRQAESIGHLYSSARTLLAPPVLLLAVGIGLLSWSGECVAFFLVLKGLGLHGGWTLLNEAAFVLAISTLVGSATLLPGGLGTAESSSAALLVAVAHTSLSVAVAATLLIRLCTLWFGVSIGVISLWIYRRRFSLGQKWSTMTLAATD